MTNTNGKKWDLRVMDKNVISKKLILHETDFKNTDTLAFAFFRDLKDDRNVYPETIMEKQLNCKITVN